MRSGKNNPFHSAHGLRRGVLLAGGFVAGMMVQLLTGPLWRRDRGSWQKSMSLRRRLLGQDYATILRALGPPHAAVLGEAAGAWNYRPENAQTWYYALSRQDALVIDFHNKIARSIEFLGPPRSNHSLSSLRTDDEGLPG